MSSGACTDKPKTEYKLGFNKLERPEHIKGLAAIRAQDTQAAELKAEQATVGCSKYK